MKRGLTQVVSRPCGDEDKRHDDDCLPQTSSCYGLVSVTGRRTRDDIGFRHREISDDAENSGREDEARHRRTQTQSALSRRLREVVTDRRSKRAGHDIDDPEGKNRVESESPPNRKDGDQRYHDDSRHQVADPEHLGHEIAGCRTERESDENRKPVERFSSSGEDGMNGERLLGQVPHEEGENKKNAEDQSTCFEWHAGTVREIVSHQCAEDAHERYRQPVFARYVPMRPELEDQSDDEQGACDDGRTGQAKVQVDVEEVGGGFTNCRAEHFDDPEVDGNFWDFAEELPARRAGALRSHWGILRSHRALSRSRFVCRSG